MTMPRAKYPEDSTFGKRIKEMAQEKQRVAREVVDRFLGSGGSAFISDGSSTLYVGLAIFEAAAEQKKKGGLLETEIHTNNLAIAHEYPLWDTPKGELPGVKVYIAEGTVESDLTMVCGDQANSSVIESAGKVQFLVLSVRALFGKYGPAGKEAESLRIKKVALRSGAHDVQGVIFVADHSKLSQPYNKGIPLVYALKKKWEELMENENTYLVSTRHPKFNPAAESTPTGSKWENPQTEKDCYLVNHKRLTDVMNRGVDKRFVEI